MLAGWGKLSNSTLGATPLILLSSRHLERSPAPTPAPWRRGISAPRLTMLSGGTFQKCGLNFIPELWLDDKHDKTNL